MFAWGFISIEGRYELMAAYAPDGREFCFTVTNEQCSHFEIWHTNIQHSSPRIKAISSIVRSGPADMGGMISIFLFEERVGDRQDHYPTEKASARGIKIMETRDGSGSR